MGTTILDWSPLFAAGLSIVVYLFICMRKSLSIIGNMGSIIGYQVVYGVTGLIVTIVMVSVLTVIYKSPQGPLILIDYGPIGVAIGQILGLVIWVKTKGNKFHDGR